MLISAVQLSNSVIYKHFIHILFHYGYHNKLWKILKEIGIPDHLTCLLINQNVGQEATVRTGHGTTDWFQIRKGVHQACVLSPCLFNLYAEYIMQNARLNKAQAGIKIARRNVNNLRYADGRKQKPKGPLNESEKVDLKLNIQKNKIMASSPITYWQIDGEIMETVRDFMFFGLQNHCRRWLQTWN